MHTLTHGRSFWRAVFITLSAALLLVPALSQASGLFVPPYNDRIYQVDQEAIIFFDDGQEDLILTTTFRGNAEEFAWIIPTPTKPEVDRGSWETFVALRDITKTAQDDFVISGYGAAAELSLDAYAPAPEVEVVESKSVAYYDITVLDAPTTQSLLDWLNDNGFSYPDDGVFVLEDYVDAGWYFTAVKLNTSELSESTKADIKKGSSMPLHLQFEADKPVYPLSLSQVSRMYSAEAPDATDVRNFPKFPSNIILDLFLITENKQRLPGFQEAYAGYIAPEVVETLSYQVDGDPLLNADEDTDYVLTKLTRSFPVSEMTYDLYPRDEENDKLLNDKDAADMKKALLWGLVAAAAVLVVVLVVVLVMMSRENKESKQ